MDDSYTKKVRSAAIAGWWAVLIAGLWLTAAWLIWLGILAARPGWLITLWGGQITWDEVHSVTITFMAVAKLMLLAGVWVVIWLSLWARRLNRQAPA